MSDEIYLDCNATTAPLPEVVQAVADAMRETWANASSRHAPGQRARRLLVSSRATAARALGCKPSELVFTSGASESNHLAVLGLLGAASADRPRVVFSAGEHAGHMRLADSLARRGVPVDFIPLRSDGSLDMDAAARLIGPDVAVVSVTAANNETGVLMPVSDLAGMARSVGARLHADATQYIGKLPFDFASFKADAVSMSAHKIHGPKGVGALLLRDGVALAGQFPGSQERNRRGGTENLPAIAGFAVALERMGTAGEINAEANHQTALRDGLERGLRAALPVRVFGAQAARLPGTSYLRIGLLEADTVLQRLEQLGVAASSGSACSSSGSEPSRVLTAMGVPRDEALGAVRFSLGRETRAMDIDHVLAELPPLLAPLLQDLGEAVF
jgi:cysteine desulfurase